MCQWKIELYFIEWWQI